MKKGKYLYKALVYSLINMAMFTLMTFTMSMKDNILSWVLSILILVVNIMILSKTIKLSDVIMDRWVILWYAVDMDGCRHLFTQKPGRGENRWVSPGMGRSMVCGILGQSLPDITWDNEPVPLKISSTEEL